ncbi:Gfo/Idh/MocA family protein [Halogeometricum limi]|uniref:UDP-N-acetylglucosamine 3-dehydrogenase n=1 Tax=Halogeometricum limi TaxID=555875 RepID=A0A1I6HU62_9EURY|nr:Gfo/Idh/MocA family oxidoreductase [Halogeometricum limi]SFR57780.1 UDP-N-acetylglucosamine 3-dehydrogenase [Halogeometricum limi]
MGLEYGVVGTGYWGSNHVRVAAELVEAGDIDSLTLCDIDEERASEMADSYGVPYVTSISDLVASGVDAVVVATPSVTHHEVGCELLDAGVDVLVEKPLATTSRDAWSLVERAEANDCVLGVGHIFRSHPALRDLKRRIDRGELGEIRYLTTTRYAFRTPRPDAGALYSLAVHDVDVYSHLLDARPDSVYCRLDSNVRDGIDETATLTLSYGDVTGVINESWHVPVFDKRRDLTVVGSKRSAHIDYLEDTVVEIHDAEVVREEGVLQARDEGVRRHEVDGGEPLRLEVEAFVDACETRTDPPATGRVGAETVELLEAAERSDELGESVSLPAGVDPESVPAQADD